MSSFLARCAGRYGLSACRFRSFHFPEFPTWTRDIDRSATRQFLHAIATKTGLTPARVTTMTLLNLERVVSARHSRGTAAWVNALGVYHRDRRLHGLQYCPTCLAAVPGYKRVWRLSFVVACETHHCALRDGCPYCDAPIVPHRQLAETLRCHTCHRSLVGPLSPVLELPSAAVAQQNACLHALVGGFVTLERHQVSAPAYFRGLRILASAVLGRGGTRSARGIDRSGAVERMRIAERAGLLGEINSVLAAWPESFRTLATERRWTRRTFCRVSVPAWLYSEIRHLPGGQRRSAASQRSLRAQLVSLGRRRPVGWRARRAVLLLEAARNRRP